jgi:hypothetical protein
MNLVLKILDKAQNLKYSTHMKAILQIDGETFEVEGWSFESVIQELGELAGLIGDTETIKILDPQQLDATTHV